jgi:hypothetical protein
MTGRILKHVLVSTLEAGFFGRPDTSQPFYLFLTFSKVTGPAGTPGREAVVMMRPIELSGALSYIPASEVTDPEDRAALDRVRQMLRRMDPGAR